MKQGFTTRASFDAAAQQVAGGRARLTTANASAAKAPVQIGSGTASSGMLAAAQAAMAECDKSLLATGNWVQVTQRVPLRIAIDDASPRTLLAGLSAKVEIDVRDAGRDHGNR